MWALMLNYRCSLPGLVDNLSSTISQANIQNPVSNVTVDDHTESGLLWKIGTQYVVIGLSLSEPHTSRTTMCTRVYVSLFACQSKDGPWTGQFDDLSQDHSQISIHVHTWWLTGLLLQCSHS